MATIVTIVTLLVTAYFLQGVATTAQATTEELLTELDKPSEYLFSYKLQIKFLICFVKKFLSPNVTLKIVPSGRRIFEPEENFF